MVLDHILDAIFASSHSHDAGSISHHAHHDMPDATNFTNINIHHHAKTTTFVNTLTEGGTQVANATVIGKIEPAIAKADRIAVYPRTNFDMTRYGGMPQIMVQLTKTENYVLSVFMIRALRARF